MGTFGNQSYRHWPVHRKVAFNIENLESASCKFQIRESPSWPRNAPNPEFYSCKGCSLDGWPAESDRNSSHCWFVASPYPPPYSSQVEPNYITVHGHQPFFLKYYPMSNCLTLFDGQSWVTWIVITYWTTSSLLFSTARL